MAILAVVNHVMHAGRHHIRRARPLYAVQAGVAIHTHAAWALDLGVAHWMAVKWAWVTAIKQCLASPAAASTGCDALTQLRWCSHLSGVDCDVVLLALDR
mmetsp:Transcript_23210/g.57613  ORF Transcript_23210/g.57613 Transcript_23210/m.57613 type:complete len:100 (-) Transcript_23210:1316-1615(-)